MRTYLQIFFGRNLTPELLRLFVAVLLFGIMLAQVPSSIANADGTDLSLTKSIEGGITTAQVGDTIRYRIHFACSNLTTPCGPMEITDLLQPGLIYQPPPASSVPAGFSISYNSGTRTVTITKDDNNLLDGSQYDAVIAVVVDYDLRPLPATINNTVNGRIAPTGPGNWEATNPASAPPITVGAANPYWAITKTLSSPLVNPTVNTDVTYRIQICPTTPPPGQGNVPLTNIILTDTIPAGSTFVSASNGGTHSSGTVTWPVFAGTIYPPNCLTRFVTVRYNNPPFIVTDNVTNTAHADADYIPSTGSCTTPCIGLNGDITHPINPIAEVPTYSKGDAGDPVGFTGTGRFILNLNTNNTNYPSNDLILIDNLPPQFQVTSVTSGAWSGAFDYMRAHVEYSTNYGNSYTGFAGSPITYNSNTTFAAPAANITNVRWRFEYDPDKTAPFSYTQAGLPYTWSFTTAPEIRVTPRAVATTADLPSGAAMPAAIAGNTYTNCLQTTRTASGGGSVTDPCDIEPMTVDGTFVSLRVSKNETPGRQWDDLSDPNITTFIPDGSILPGDTVRYTISMVLTERSSEDLVNPTIQDTLPPGTDFVFVRNGTATLDGGPVAAPTFTQAGRVLTWTWNSLTIPQPTLGIRTLTVEFFGYVSRGQTPGTYTNDLYAVTDSAGVFCEIGTSPTDSGDIDTDGNTTETGCRNPDTYVVERSAALRGEKWVRSISPNNSEVVLASTFLPDASCPDGGTQGITNIPTNPFTRYPCIAQAFPEGALSPGQFSPPTSDLILDDFEYNLRIFNDGNVPMLKYVLYDILPRVGDTGSGGVLYNSARLSEFRPALRGPIQFIQGPGGLTAADFTIDYNMTTNPCRPEVFDQPIGATVPGGCNNTWVQAAGVTDWTLVRSYRIRLNNDGSLYTPNIANAVPAGSELRFGVPMHILADAPPANFDTDDVLSHEIAWNSFSHVGSYDKNAAPPISIEDLLASEPRKVGITVPERMSVGNRVWRDADNSGTINPPDDTAPGTLGIAGVTVNLYRDIDNNGTPDGAAIGTTTTDSEGYYLFSNIPYDSAVMNNNRYIIGIPASNFNAGQPLESLRSSTGTPAVAAYTNPTTNVVDSADDGRDPTVVGQEVFSWSFILQPTTEPTSEADLSNNNRDGPAGQRRGVNGERNNNSDLTIDFGFFGGTDVPFSIGNHVWKDNGQTAPGVFNYALRNDGIRQATEPPVVGALVRLYRDGNANGIPEASERIRTDITDATGFYLFDNLDPGPYYVEIAPSNFQTGGPLAGWYSSQVTGTENVGVPGNPYTPSMDSDDNGIDRASPENTGIFSGLVVLTRGTPEPLLESHLSSDTGSLPGFNPTEDDGPGSIGRFGEVDSSSNATIDFGFIPPMSLGNRVWFDDGSGSAFRVGYNNGFQDGTEVGVSGVSVQLWRDTNGTPGLQVTGAPPDTLLFTTSTDASGYYLFDRLQPADNYYVYIPTANFTGGGALVNYISSTDANQATTPADDFEDMDDDGIDNPPPATNGVTSPRIVMVYNSEPLTSANETDINTTGTYGPNNVGNYGQEDGDSNLTMDFGFVRPPRSLGNYLWIDANNNRAFDGGETPVPTGVRVSLYQDSDGNGTPDDLNIIGNNTDDWLAYDLTDANGYYLFDKLPAGRYIIGVDYTNFAVAGLLEGYTSSRGNVDNATNNTDSRDNGRDRLQMGNPALSPYGILSTSINLTATPVNAPTGETGSGDTSITLGFNPTAGDGTNSRGRYGETDANSDLTIDFGFFIPLSLGNRVFIDDGAGGGVYNNGIMDGAEVGVNNVRVELWRDANTNGVPDLGGFVDFDTTAAGGGGGGIGYYLFDNLAPGSYVVLIAGSNFSSGGVLAGYNSSIPTGTENVGVALNPYTPNTDRDDNGINNGSPTTIPAVAPGILSGTLTLAYSTEATGEIELSSEADPGSPANLAFDPTGWDGPLSRGRWEERDNNSNLTIDFGFIPVFSLGNRVWFDTNNNSAINIGTESGVNNVRVQLFDSTGTTEIPVGPDGILYTTDDANGGMLTAGGGYYRFNNLLAGDYLVRIPASNFSAGQPLYRTWSSGTTITNAGVTTETAAPDVDTVATDSDDNGTRDGATGNVDSLPVTLGPLSTPEPLGETDLSGGQGQPDTQANMTVDFGFYNMTLGNLVWGDGDNDGTLNGAEVGINGVTVQLWSQDLSTLLATTTTAGGGVYTFPGLAAGNYIVRLPAANFNAGGALQNYRSSTGTIPPSTYEPAPNPDAVTTDSDDNGTEMGGILGTGGYIQTSVFALTPAGEQSTDNTLGLTTENRVDFGVVDLVAIGNRIWFDTGAGAFYNNGILDAGEIPVDNVTIQLYTSAGIEVPVGLDGIMNTADDAPGGVQTNGGGYYYFDRLLSGTYYVLIPATEFQAGGDLFGYVSSLGAGANETSDNDVDENGIDVATLTTTGIRTQNYTLLPNTERAGEDQSNYIGALDDNNVNFTADFGFTQLVAIGNRVWNDDGSGGGTIDDGIQNGTEAGIDGVTVELYTSPGNVLVASTTTATVAGQPGSYQFTNLNPGSYYVRIPASMFDVTLPSPLRGYVSSTGNGTNETSDQDVDENGIDVMTLATTGINTPVYTLSIGGETTADDETTYTGYLTDNNVNFTADFGFLAKVAIGNIVWLDNGAGGGTANDGIQNGTEPGISGVDLQLYRVGDTPSVTPPLQTTTTNANGFYFFDNLLPGDYFIFIPAPEFQGSATLAGYNSSTGNGANETSDQDADENGIDDTAPWTNGITSTNYDLQPNTERTGEGQSNYTGQLDDDNVNFTADFGFFNNPQIDLGVTKDDGTIYYLAGGTLTYAVTVVNNGPIDVSDLTVSDTRPVQIDSWTWVCTSSTPNPSPATYGCTPDASNPSPFTDNLNLPVGASVTYTVAANVDAAATGVLTNTVSVRPPSGTVDTFPPNDNDDDVDQPASLTVIKDDGYTLVAPGTVLTYDIDITNNGGVNLTSISVTDTLPADVTYQSANPAPATNVGGVLTWTGISLNVGITTTIRVTMRVNDSPTGTSILNDVEVEDRNTGARDDDDDLDTIVLNNAKVISGIDIDVDPDLPSHPTPPALPNVLIGETITYQVSLTVPAGNMDNLVAVDVMDEGLTFVRCVSIDAGASGDLVTDLSGDFAAACNAPTNPGITAEPVGDPSLIRQGRRATFALGNVQNTGSDDETLTITYEAVVLDIAANNDNGNDTDGTLNNTITWIWDSGTRVSTSPPVNVTEPELSIDKNATPTIAPLGATITFTIDIAHTVDSSTDAFDVIVEDPLPVGLDYVVGSYVYSGTAPAPTFTYDAGTRTLLFVWDIYPLGSTASITFQASFIGPSPLVNTASVEWTSLPIDPALPGGLPVQQSPFNQYSTERWYDPSNPAGIDNYGVNDNVTLRVPENLPETGFAPGILTDLPAQPADKRYTGMSDMWLEIPTLGLNLPLTGVPLSDEGWDLTWLSDQAGYLEGTTYPGQIGTTGITSHVTLADGTPGPFSNLGQLMWGDQVILHTNGYRHVYEVRERRTVLPTDFSIFKQDGYTWLTLLTCKGYVPRLDSYNYRQSVRAVLLSVEPDTADSPFSSRWPDNDR